MNVEWDDNKARANYRKHGVDFPDAALALTDELAVTILDESSAEKRYVTLGLDPLGRLLVVVYTHRGENIRIISAQKATAQERKVYED